MAQNHPKDMPRIMPMLSYEDVGAALDWLAGAFGLRERLRYAEPDGTITHAEMELADGVVMLGHPGPEYQSPSRHRVSCEPARRWSATPYVIDGVHVYVDDVDSHFRRAKQTGATILSELEETPYGARRYRVEDLEGHRWMFSQQVRDVAPADWGATEA
jgi:uncharacterized glyoxalase superfamily protein PhnB